MEQPPVLIVHVDPSERQTLKTALQGLDYPVITAESFQEARTLLGAVKPALVITPLKLREFNGIHLALVSRSRAPQAQVIVLGHEDPVLRREAAAAGATYLVNADPERVADAARDALSKITRRWPRARVELDAEVGQQSARIIDVSYGGLRLETHATDLQLNRPLPVVVGAVRVDAIPIWSKRDVEDEETCFYGATVAGGPESHPEWQALVDAALQGAV